MEYLVRKDNIKAGFPTREVAEMYAQKIEGTVEKADVKVLTDNPRLLIMGILGQCNSILDNSGKKVIRLRVNEAAARLMSSQSRFVIGEDNIDGIIAKADEEQFLGSLAYMNIYVQRNDNELPTVDYFVSNDDPESIGTKAISVTYDGTKKFRYHIVKVEDMDNVLAAFMDLDEATAYAAEYKCAVTLDNSIRKCEELIRKICCMRDAALHCFGNIITEMHINLPAAGILTGGSEKIFSSDVAEILKTHPKKPVFLGYLRNMQVYFEPNLSDGVAVTFYPFCHTNEHVYCEFQDI